MSVQSVTFGFSESCGISHEFLRRACSHTPNNFCWAGDLLVTESTTIKQSEQNDMRGFEEEVTLSFPASSDSCSEVVLDPPGAVEIDETQIRTQASGEETSAGSFTWAVPKSSDLWETDILASNDIYCGVLTDGGDIYSNESVLGRVDSLCGTIRRDLLNPSAHFLDNRRTLPDDPDKGLLFSIRNGLSGEWEVRWVDDRVPLTVGLSDSLDISAAFRTALAGQGMTEQDVYSFGMI